MIKPPRLRNGDTVGVVAPGGAVIDREALDRGVSALETLGHPVRVGASVAARAGYLAGNDTLRCEDLVEMFSAPDVRAIFCARGGYGVTRVLPLLDPLVLTRQPKIFVGYSDVSPLLVALVQRGGMVAFHGPMVAADFGGRSPAAERGRAGQAQQGGLDEESSCQLLALLGGSPRCEVPIPRVARPGVARGMLVGGCLSLLAATTGTPYALRGDGTILFVEDVGEPAYRIDRMLTQLYQGGVLAGVRGLVFGAMTNCGTNTADGHSVAAIIEEVAARLRIPVGAGVPSGHGRPNLTLPFGVNVEMALERGHGVLRLEEAAVV
jgi:muramoyltetrapeptide carboxypeptidase